MVKVSWDIQRAFKSKIGAWIGASIGFFIIGVIASVCIRAKNIVDAPVKIDALDKKVEAYHGEDDLKFSILFQHDADSKAEREEIVNIMENGFDTIIFMMTQMKNQIDINTDKINTNTNDNIKQDDRLWDLNKEQK